jgi:hypothetical protein
MRPRTALWTLIFGVSVFLVAAMTYAADAEPDSTANQPESLSTAYEKAKADFHPIDAGDVAQAKTVLLEALGRLDEKLTQAGSYGPGWREYLHWNVLQDELGGEKPDLARLTRIHAFFVRGYDGLELAWFADVQHALHNYVATAGAVGKAGIRTAYEKKLGELAKSLKAYTAKPTSESALAITEAVRWLQDAHQAPALVRAIQDRFVHPNVIGEISAELVGAGIVDSVDDVTQISDCILGTSIVGTAHTVGKTSVSLMPNSDVGVIDTLFFGKTHSENVGEHGPVTIFSSGETSLAGVKRIWINENGLSAHPAASNAETSITIQDIQSRKGRRMIERMAWKRAGKQKAKAECIASQHAEERLNERIDAQASEPLDKANEQYVEKYKRPFSERNLFPQMLRFSSTGRALHLLALQAGGGKLAAPGLPPPVVEGADMTLRLHESAVNNLAFDALAGRTVYEEKVQSAVTKALGHLPEKLRGDEDGKPWAITFASRRPISVSFVDGGFKVSIRGVKYYKGKDGYPAMVISAVYKIEKTATGFKAGRQGEIEVVPPDAEPGQQIDTQRQIISTLLRKRFGKVFEPEILGKGIELSGKWKAAGKLVPIQVECRDGWLVIAWKRESAIGAQGVAAK